MVDYCVLICDNFVCIGDCCTCMGVIAYTWRINIHALGYQCICLVDYSVCMGVVTSARVIIVYECMIIVCVQVIIICAWVVLLHMHG